MGGGGGRDRRAVAAPRVQQQQQQQQQGQEYQGQHQGQHQGQQGPSHLEFLLSLADLPFDLALPDAVADFYLRRGGLVLAHEDTATRRAAALALEKLMGSILAEAAAVAAASRPRPPPSAAVDAPQPQPPELAPTSLDPPAFVASANARAQAQGHTPPAFPPAPSAKMLVAEDLRSALLRKGIVLPDALVFAAGGGGAGGSGGGPGGRAP